MNSCQLIFHGVRRFLVVQCPGLSPPTLKAQAQHPARHTKTLPATLLRRKGREKQNKTKLKKPKKMNRQNPRTNVKSKSIQTKITQRSIHIHTHKKRTKKKYIYLCSQIPPPQSWDDLLSIQMFHRCRVHQVDRVDLIRCF